MKALIYRALLCACACACAFARVRVHLCRYYEVVCIHQAADLRSVRGAQKPPSHRARTHAPPHVCVHARKQSHRHACGGECTMRGQNALERSHTCSLARMHANTRTHARWQSKIMGMRDLFDDLIAYTAQPIPFACVLNSH